MGIKHVHLHTKFLYFCCMKLFTTCILSFFLSISLFSQSISEKAYFSLLTCAPGSEIHSHFGHTAIRFVDSANYTDIVYNFGMFRYSDDFVYNFVKGETYYHLGVTSFSRFITEYYFDERSVIEQVLNFTPQQVQTLNAMLEKNAMPEHRTYLYNFLYDNCATRPRDLIIQVLGDSLQWNIPTTTAFSDTLWFASSADLLQKDSLSRTWRALLHKYVHNYSWLRFGIGLALGEPTDKPATVFESMFLPDFLSMMVQHATITTANGIKPLVCSTQTIIAAEPIQIPPPFALRPSGLFWIFTFICFTIVYIEYKMKKHLYWFDSFLYILIGLLGGVLTFLSFFSIHPVVFPNYNILWASPIHVIFALVWFIPKLRPYTQWYLLLYGIIFLLYIGSIPFNPQYMHAGYAAIIIMLLSRVGSFIINSDKQMMFSKHS